MRLLLLTAVMALAHPALAQDTAPDTAEPQSIVAAVEAGEGQEYVLFRCAGFYKAMLTAAGGPDAGTATADEAVAALQALVGVLVERQLAAVGAASDDSDAIDDAVATLTPQIDEARDFYLRHVLDRQAQGLSPMGSLLVADSEACRYLRSTAG